MKLVDVLRKIGRKQPGFRGTETAPETGGKKH